MAHVFGGEDGRYRVTFRAEPDEVLALQHMGEPYFRAGWGSNVVGMLLDERTDWTELAELLTDSYRLQAPARLAEQVGQPGEEPLTGDVSAPEGRGRAPLDLRRRGRGPH